MPPDRKDGSTFSGVLSGMGAGALWGLVFLAPELVRGFGPLQLSIGRYLCYGAASAVLVAPRLRRVLAAVEPREWLSLAWLALAGNTLYYVFLSAAVQAGGVAMTSLVIGFLPVAVTVIGSRDRDAVPLARLAPSLLLCAGGAVCIGWQALAAPASGAAGSQAIGLACAIGALVSWTAFAIGNARCLARTRVSVHEWNLLTGLVTGAQALALLPLSLLLDDWSRPPAEWLTFAGVSIGVALFASIVGNALWNRMSRLLPLTLVGQMILFETLFALLYGFAWEHRLPTPLELGAFALVVASVVSCISAHRRKR
ncbi:DMT family transporter [Novosphingobium resinovorum]|uniref:DMT family transporter n=1 Tax=Novosphingobium resinovorum TaxID=158500 RepID=UPI003AF34C8C